MHRVSADVSVDSILIKGFHRSFRPCLGFGENGVFEPVRSKIEFSTHWCLDKMRREKMKVDAGSFIWVPMLNKFYLVFSLE